MVPGRGFEPRFTASKAAVLPLDDPGVGDSSKIGELLVVRIATPSTYILGTSPSLLAPRLRISSNFEGISNLIHFQKFLLPLTRTIIRQNADQIKSRVVRPVPLYKKAHLSYDTSAKAQPYVEISRISAQRQRFADNSLTNNPMMGTIKRLTDKGFGFIAQEGAEKDVFFHSSSLVDVQFDDLRVDDKVSFEVEESDKGPRAVNVQRA